MKSTQRPECTLFRACRPRPGSACSLGLPRGWTKQGLPSHFPARDKRPRSAGKSWQSQAWTQDLLPRISDSFQKRGEPPTHREPSLGPNLVPGAPCASLSPDFQPPGPSSPPHFVKGKPLGHKGPGAAGRLSPHTPGN